MPSKNPAQRLRDIIDNIDAIEVFTARLDFPAFRADRKTVYAVVRALEIVSEASAHQVRNPRLADTEHLRGAGLGQFAFPDEGNQSPHHGGPDSKILRLGGIEAEIGENVGVAFGLCRALHHFLFTSI
jgi:hypothetical protein